MVLEINIGDVVKLKKVHPCGGYEWRVVRVGADISTAVAAFFWRGASWSAGSKSSFHGHNDSGLL